MKNSKLKREFSAGGVVYKKSQAKILFLLGKHSGYHKWVLPKGLIEGNEKFWQTAIRETEEEMGVKTKLVKKKPIHKETYFYWADLKEENKPKPGIKDPKKNRETRRVEKYQEEGGVKVKVFKTVTFFLLEYLSGEPQDHGWEMEEAGWYSFEEALEKMSFKGEKEAVRIATGLL